MPRNYLQEAADTLQRLLERDASVTVMYHQKGTPPFPVIAVPGRTVTENDAGTGFIVRTVSRDFTIRASRLQGLIPKRNDEIRMMVGGEEQIYTVNGDSTSSHYEEVDAYGIAYRIHTKRDRVSA